MLYIRLGEENAWCLLQEEGIIVQGCRLHEVVSFLSLHLDMIMQWISSYKDNLRVALSGYTDMPGLKFFG